MKARILVVTSMLVVLALLLSAKATAQGARPLVLSVGSLMVLSPWKSALSKPTLHPEGLEVGLKDIGSTSITLGNPGLSFRYVQTFGTTQEPFIETNDHFYNVEGLGVDGNSIWLTDSWGDRVLKFDNAGNFQQKIGKAGVLDYNGTSLDYIADVTVDSNGNIWVVDGGAAHVVAFDSSGQVVKELGQRWNPGSGNDQFNDPISIAFDSAGNIYVSDSGLWGNYGNHRVQVFDSNGNYITTIGQTGVCGSSNNQLCRPRHIAIYGNRLYVADADNHRVQIFDITDPASPSYVATLGVTGVPGSDNAHFNQPEGVGVDASYIYVADSNNNRVQIFDRNTLAYVATIGGSYGQGDYQFNHPTDVVVDASGNIYVADNWNNRVQQFNSSRVYQRTYGTTGVPYVTDGYHYYSPFGVAVAQDGSIYIVEERGHRLVKLNAAGEPQWTIGEPGRAGSDNAHFFGPRDVAVDGNGRVYTVESWGNHRVQIFNNDGSYYATLGQGWGTGNYNFKNPSGIAIDRQGNIYVADSGNHRVQIYNNQLVYVATLGESGVPGSDNAHFNNPFDVAVDSQGNIYVADEGNDRVQVFDKHFRYVRTIGGGGSGDDFGHFGNWGPHHLAVDSQDRLYVVDSENQRVQVFDANGAYLTTIGGAYGTRPGQFANVMGIAVGPDDSVYVSEIHNNHRIQKFVPGVPGWKQVNINGFGEPQNLIGALEVFNGQMYAGTWRFGSGLAQVWRTTNGTLWNQFTPPWSTSGVVVDVQAFGPYLYVGTASESGGEVWRTDGMSWEQVVSGGFGDTNNVAVNAFAVFSNTLYAATSNWTTGVEIWRSLTGDNGTWSQVNSDGFGSAGTWQDVTMEVYGGNLYVGIGRNGVAELWRTNDGITWTSVFTDGLAVNNTHVSAMAEFNGYFYIGLRNTTTGGEVWRSTDGLTWTPVFTGGLGNSANGRPYGLIPFENYLYLVFSNTETGAEVWRTADGSTWERVGFAGWGDSNNGFADYFDKGAAIFNNRLYIGTLNGANGGEVWLYLHNKTYLPLVLRD